jgi:hypothetical protein
MMAKFNTKANPTAKTAKLRTETTPTTTTFNGAVGYEKEAHTQLIMLAASFMGGDSNFYETDKERFARLKELVSKTALTDNGEWIYNLVNWIRNTAQMRTVAVVVAVEAVRVRLSIGKADTKADTTRGTINRRIIDVACARGDEPGELLAYYTSQYGKPIPQPIKNGVADAATRLYTERSYLRFGERGNAGVSFRDVIRLTRPKPQAEWQSNLFAYITADETPVDVVQEMGLNKIHARRVMMRVPMEERNEAILGYMRSEYTWLKDAEFDHMTLPGYLGRKLKANEWAAIVPNMGVQALLMNLNSIMSSGPDDATVNFIKQSITDPEAVRRSRVFPMAFYNAYRYATTDRFSWELEQGLNLCLENIESLPGKTLVMVDRSGSMGARLSPKSQLTYADAASIFGAALKARNPNGVKLVQYGTSWSDINTAAGTSVLKIMKRFKDMGGTNTALTLEQCYTGEDRVIIITDEQANSLYYWLSDNYRRMEVGANLPKSTRMYTWNLAGYAPSHAEFGKGNKFLLGGGFSDASFKTIPMLEKISRSGWPWENQ